jgi:hypothetical protein
MSGEAEPEDNVDRLLEHLKDDSLAARLVRAHRAQHPQGPAAAMKAVLLERLEQLKAKLYAAAD